MATIVCVYNTSQRRRLRLLLLSNIRIQIRMKHFIYHVAFHVKPFSQMISTHIYTHPLNSVSSATQTTILTYHRNALHCIAQASNMNCRLFAFFVIIFTVSLQFLSFNSLSWHVRYSCFLFAVLFGAFFAAAFVCSNRIARCGMANTQFENCIKCSITFE